MYTYYRCNSEGFELLSETELPQAVPENVCLTSDRLQENVPNSFYDFEVQRKYMNSKENSNSEEMPSAVPSVCRDTLDNSDKDSATDAGNTGQELGQSNMGELYSGGNIDSTDMDSTLMEATSKAMACGSLMPLIKEELKLAIQTKRLKEGKGELQVDFNTPAPYMLTEEEVEKVKKRRDQNREAARRFRERQKSKGNSLHKECQRLESANTQLRYIAAQLRDERNKLRAGFESHARVCPYRPPAHFYKPSSPENNT